jgi:uncharacterized protein (DUF433 family)
MAKTIQCRISELKTTFFVRTGLDQEHVLKLADLYSAGEKLPAIKITPNKEIIDGRHRVEAQEVAFTKDTLIDCEVISSNDPLDLIAAALQSNEGGPLPSSRADMVHTIGLMLSRGATDRAILDKLNFLPRGVIRKYMEIAKSNLKKRQIQQAKEAVSDGATVKEAAERFGLDVKDLKAAIAGPKIAAGSSGLEKLTSTISNRFFAMNRSNQAMVKRVVTGYSDGEVPEKVVDSVLTHIEKLLAAAQRRSKDWRKRFEAAKEGKFFSWHEIDKGSVGLEDEQEAA